MSAEIVELQIPPLPYYLGSGRSEFSIGDRHPNRKKLGIYDLLIMVKGELHIGEDGQEWTLQQGDTLLLEPDAEHYAVKPCEQDTIFYWVHFEHHLPPIQPQAEDAPSLSRPFNNAYTLRLPKHAQLSSPAAIHALMEQLLALPMTHSFWQEQRCLTDLLSMLEEGEISEAGLAAARLAEKASAYIREHYREKVTNKALSSALHFHSNYIVRCMKSRYGRTPLEYLQDFRLEQAKRLLITTEWSIERIAEEIGFRYAPYFSACFKQNVGISPFHFRKQYFS
ncbi:AraC family transcriptional regulator [Paenibacillus sanguinis]|uniref:AraC family transcriptional regulator n=1 Tax=Paenibacillus sanguinis TaxID=225906 RepID=UPI00037D6F45|nr:AraC family transcriptional regulator [Paenibacillus sanguinis]